MVKKLEQLMEGLIRRLPVEQRQEVQHELDQFRSYLPKLSFMNFLMDHTPDIIYFKDEQSRFVYINRSHALRLGLDDPSQAIGKTDFDFHPKEMAQKYFDDEQRVLKGESLVGIVENYVDKTSGKIKVTSTTKLPLRDAEGRIYGIAGVNRDITDFKEAQEKLKQAEIIEHIDSLKNTLLHELNNKFTPVLGYSQLVLGDLAQLLEEANSSPPSYEKLRSLHEQAQKVFEAATQTNETMGKIREVDALSSKIEYDSSGAKIIDLSNQKSAMEYVLNTFLVVDDEKFMPDLFKNVFSRKGWTVDSASNGEEAIGRIRLKNYPIVIMDYNMPVMNGIEAFTQINEMIKSGEILKPQIIMITGFATEELTAKFKALGAYSTISKPFNMIDLGNLITKAYQSVIPELK